MEICFQDFLISMEWLYVSQRTSVSAQRVKAVRLVFKVLEGKISKALSVGFAPAALMALSVRLHPPSASSYQCPCYAMLKPSGKKRLQGGVLSGKIALR